MDRTVVTLKREDARNLAWRLSQLEDWLLHAGAEVRDKLAAAAFEGCWNPQLFLGALIDDLGRHAVALTQQLPPEHAPDPAGRLGVAAAGRPHAQAQPEDPDDVQDPDDE